MKRQESGNVIFYVLIAVALLAGLSYTVAHSLRGGGQAISEEGRNMNASAMIEYGNIMAQAVSQLRLRGYRDTDLSFQNEVVEGYENPSCAEDGCKLFHINGGGVSYVVPKAEWLDNAQKDQSEFGTVYFNASTRVQDIGTEADDLLMIIPYVKKEICLAINRKLGITLSDQMIPRESSGPAAMNSKFTGIFDTVADTEISGIATPGNGKILHGKSAGCTEGSGAGSTPAEGTYHFYQVLMSR
jgi:hypothetical protein